MPARLQDPNDPYGSAMFLSSLFNGDYDIVFVLNDTFAVEGVASHLEELKRRRADAGRKPFKLVYYFPVDCRLRPDMLGMLRHADIKVAYTDFAKEEGLKVGIESDQVIYHGVDINTFYPLPREERLRWRREYLQVEDPNQFIIVNVNRNSRRKDIARTIHAFHEFKKQVPNSLLYLHTLPQDKGAGSNELIDLFIPCQQLDLQLGRDVIFPKNYTVVKGFPEAVLNRLYNCGDAFLSTHVGEGFGLTVVESMSAGTPVIVPDNTSMPEIVGRERGFMYECKEMCYVDNSGFRPVGRLEDIVQTMHKAYRAIQSGSALPVRQKAREFAEQYSWDNVCKHWQQLFLRLAKQVLVEQDQRQVQAQAKLVVI